MTNDKKELDKIIKLKSEYSNLMNSKKEEDMQKFFTKNKELFALSYGGGGHSFEIPIVIPKFKFGNQFISDFIFISRELLTRETIIEICLIELEPCTASIYNKDLSYAKRLNGAIAQIANWTSWIDTNFLYFVESIKGAMKKIDSCADFFSHSITDYINDRYEHEKTKFVITSKIIIGRRSMLNEEASKLKVNYYLNSNRKSDIATYDGFLDNIEIKIQYINGLYHYA